MSTGWVSKITEMNDVKGRSPRGRPKIKWIVTATEELDKRCIAEAMFERWGKNQKKW